MKKLFLLFLLLPPFGLVAQELNKAQYKEDFEFLWTTIKDDYCYWDKKQTDWEAARRIYLPLVDTVSSRNSFVLLLEQLLNELYDHHISLSTNTRESQRLVPSGTDIWAEYVNGKPVITELRSGFGAQTAGLKPGMEIIAFNDIPVEKAIKDYLPKTLVKQDKEANDYALRVLLAGRFIDRRKITAKDGGVTKEFFPDDPVALLREQHYADEIESRMLKGKIGYIRINNQLGDNNIIHRFDSVMRLMNATQALILDLRETPSGGNTTVARAILGSFIRKQGFYQQHELTAEERQYGIKRSWVEIVSPRKEIYSKPLVVLVNHWTGSVAEGITIGFDALKRATIIGLPMAGLNGAVYSYQMPHSKIGFAFPVEKLFHLNGQPREKFQPQVLTDLRRQEKEDLVLKEALNYISRKYQLH